MSKIFFFCLVLTVFCAYANATVCFDPNSSWSQCGKLCIKTCSNPKPTGLIACPKIGCSLFTAGCRCNPGFLRLNALSPVVRCVRPKDCPKGGK